MPLADGHLHVKDTGADNVEDCSEQRQCHLKQQRWDVAKVELVENKTRCISNEVLTRLIFDFGEQEDSLREAWNSLDHSVHQRSTVLKLRGRRLALCWGLEHGRKVSANYFQKRL